MALGLTQLLTEMSTRSISVGKGDRCVRLTTYHYPVPFSRNLGALTSWNPLGLSRPVMGLLYLLLLLLHLPYHQQNLTISWQRIQIRSLLDMPPSS